MPLHSDSKALSSCLEREERPQTPRGRVGPSLGARCPVTVHQEQRCPTATPTSKNTSGSHVTHNAQV